MIVFAEIGGQVEREQGISVGEIVATDEQTLVFAKLSGSGKQTATLLYSVPARSWAVSVARCAVAVRPNTAQSLLVYLLQRSLFYRLFRM